MSDSESVGKRGTSESGCIYEIFSGIQGEGLLVGERQIFIRFAGCNLSCAFCDTPHARTPVETGRIEQTAGARDFSQAPNPLRALDVAAHAERLDSPRRTPPIHRRVALTGGEPLAQAEFAGRIARELKERGFSVLLETNGSLPDALPAVIPFVDVVSMDVKLPSAAGGPNLLSRHELFLRRAASAEVYVKIVVTSSTSTDELLQAARMVGAINPAIPLVLQPVTPLSGVLSPSAAQVLEWQARFAVANLRDVRVIPQCHKIIGQS